MRIPVVKEGYLFITVSGTLMVIVFLFGHTVLGAVIGLAFIFFIVFFRDPTRVIPPGNSLIVSPADGKVIRVDTTSNGDHGDNKKYQRVSIFMSIFDAHVNRAPVDGVIEDISYTEGKFFPAFKEAASFFNEQNTITIDSKIGRFKVTQVAGVIARRIVCYGKKGKTIQRGEKIGMIKFGSRVDLYLPPTTEIIVAKGDQVKSGSSVLARIPGQEEN